MHEMRGSLSTPAEVRRKYLTVGVLASGLFVAYGERVCLSTAASKAPGTMMSDFGWTDQQQGMP